MTETEVLHIAQQAILITFKLCAPILMVSLTIGVASIKSRIDAIRFANNIVPRPLRSVTRNSG